MGYAFLQGTVLDDGGLPCEGRFAWGYSIDGTGNIFAPQYTWWQRSVSPYDQFPFWNYPPLYAHGSGLVTGDQFTALENFIPAGVPIYFQSQLRQIAVPGTVTLGAIKTFTCSMSGGGASSPPYPLPPGISGQLSPAISITSPTETTNNRTTLNGRVDYHGDRAGNVRFHWGTTTLYGMKTGWQGGYETGDTFSQVITGLGSGAAFHVRAEFDNGIHPPVFSSDLTFSTLSEQGGMVLGGGDILTLLKRGV